MHGTGGERINIERQMIPSHNNTYASMAMYKAPLVFLTIVTCLRGSNSRWKKLITKFTVRKFAFAFSSAQ